MNQVGSPYPGGPKREGSQAPSRAQLSSEERHDLGRARRKRRKVRKRRVVSAAVIAVALLTAATLGYTLGDQVRTAGLEGTAEGRDALTTEELITSEMNRLLLELWEMEALEQR